jgi:hypothetical protein
MMATLASTALLQGPWGPEMLVATLSELLAPPRARTGELLRATYSPFSSVNDQVVLPDTEITVKKEGI